MKKNISINISGIIFHIEEDAYEKLRDYLHSINRYFSNFDDSAEIVADIESRIAEIFLTKLSEEKQVITDEDVEALIATMGNVSDFRAMEEEEPVAASSSTNEESANDSYRTYETETKRLFRDESRRVIGGVSAGIAHYFSIDPVWIRLAFVISLLVYGVGIIPYIILWIVIPGKYNLPEQKSTRKMYRNPDDRVLGGVSSGIAAYFGIDVIIIRLLFVIFAVFGGTGLLVYIVLWIALPEASSISDKVRMQGDPVTLENIETNIKKNLNIDEKKEEDTITKVLLFPFRLIAAIIKGIGKILGPVLLFIVEAIRVLAGIILVFIGFILTFTFLVTTAALFGVITSAPFNSDIMFTDWGIPIDIISNSFPVLTVIAAGFFVIVPSIYLILLGVSVIAKRIVFNATVGWSLLAGFVISAIFLSINIPQIVYQFKERGSFEETMEYAYDGSITVLDLNEVGMDDYDGAGLRLRGHEDSLYRLVLRYESQGSTRLNAIENAKMFEYNVEQQDSTFVFDSNISFKDKAVFRGQELQATLYVPYGAEFIIKRPVRYILDNSLYSYNYRTSELNETIWTIEQEEGLVCVTCPEEEEPEITEMPEDTEYEFSGDFSSMETLEAYRELQLDGPIIVNIQRGESYKLLVGESSTDLWEQARMSQDNVMLDLSLDEFTDTDTEPMSITLVVPELERVSLKGSARAIITDLEQEFFNVELRDASRLTADIDIAELRLTMKGNTKAELYGEGRDLNADIEGFSTLEAYEFSSNVAQIRARGQSKAEVSATDKLMLDKNITAKVEYRGDPELIEEN